MIPTGMFSITKSENNLEMLSSVKLVLTSPLDEWKILYVQSIFGFLLLFSYLLLFFNIFYLLIPSIEIDEKFKPQKPSQYFFKPFKIVCVYFFLYPISLLETLFFMYFWNFIASQKLYRNAQYSQISLPRVTYTDTKLCIIHQIFLYM